MSRLMMCGYCCAVLSCWAILQLTLMGIFFKIEAVTLIHDAEEHEPAHHTDFIMKTKKNYSKIALNCWLTALIYAVTLLLSIGCIMTAKKQMAQSSSMDDDDAICRPKEPRAKNEKKKKEKVVKSD